MPIMALLTSVPCINNCAPCQYGANSRSGNDNNAPGINIVTIPMAEPFKIFIKNSLTEYPLAPNCTVSRPFCTTYATHF